MKSLTAMRLLLLYFYFHYTLSYTINQTLSAFFKTLKNLISLQKRALVSSSLNEGLAILIRFYFITYKISLQSLYAD